MKLTVSDICNVVKIRGLQWLAETPEELLPPPPGTVLLNEIEGDVPAEFGDVKGKLIPLTLIREFDTEDE